MNYIDYITLQNKTDAEKAILFRTTNMVYRSRSIFYEHRFGDYPFFFTLKDYDLVLPGITVPVKSFKNLYMELEDPTEYRIATEILCGWDYWKFLTNSVLISSIIETYREELAIRIRSQALALLREQSQKSVQASQFLAQGKWKTSRGRPSKAEKESLLRQEARLDEDLDELYKRALN